MKETIIKKPLAIGDTVYLTVHDTAPFCRGTRDEYYIIKTTVTDISVKHGFTLSCDLQHFSQNGRTYEHDDFRDWEEYEESVFLSEADAERSIKNAKDYAGYKFFEG